MSYRTPQPGQTRIIFRCSCGFRLNTIVDTSAVEEAKREFEPVSPNAHARHHYGFETTDGQREAA